MDELIGKYLNGYKIVGITKDPFIEGQVNLWTDDVKIEAFGDRTFTKFTISDKGNSHKVYQELVDKENYKLKEQKKKLREWLNEELQDPENRTWAMHVIWYLDELEGNNDGDIYRNNP